MSNLNLHLNLARGYHRTAFTNNYVFTFILDYKFYAVKMADLPLETLVAISCVSRASSKRGGAATLRFRPTNAIKRTIVEMGNAYVLATKAGFEELVKSNKYNKGENAEKLVTEQMFGQTWEKDSVSYKVAGDVFADGIAWQHKHEGATFCKETDVL